MSLLTLLGGLDPRLIAYSAVVTLSTATFLSALSILASTSFFPERATMSA